MDNEENKNRRFFIGKFIFGFLAVFIIGIFSAVFTEHYLLPRLSANQFFSKYSILRKAAENVTIINKTEQVTVKEEDSVNTVTSKALPAVVNIISVNTKKSPVDISLIQNKSGSGVLVTNDGLITTYRTAIIEKDAEYQILLYDGSSHPALLLGIDEFTNLAYLKIDATNLPAISFADSNDFKAGKKLIAIGNSSEEYQNRFTAGLLSNINQTFNISGKAISSSEKLEGVFETDFDNQAEYIGGPVINYNGELGGIIGSVVIDNQIKYFDIPSNMIKKSVDLVINNEINTRPILGIYYIPITKKYSIINNIDRDRGAMIFSPSGKQGLAVISGTPAEKAGLAINDIIIAVGGQEVNLDNPLSNLINQHKKGEEFDLLVIRDGKEMNIKVTL
jgi:serine protease Do